MALPHFLGLGALKAATTLLYERLAVHPSVAMARGSKEVRFFTQHWERGLGWYEGLFDGASGRVLGEVSPDYLYDPRCPGRIAQVVPHARLIAILRDPVSRTYSQFTHFRQERFYRGDFATYLREHPNALERNLYHRQLRRYLDHFPREQIQILLFEPFTREFPGSMAEVYRFIGVEPDHAPHISAEKVNASGVPRFPALFAAGSRGMAWMRERGLNRVADAIKSTGLRDRLLRPRTAETDFPPLTAADRRTIIAHAAEDVAALERLLARPLAGTLWLQEPGLTGT